MTDVELAALLRETLPEELSPGQLRLLKRRMPHSAELRAAFAEQLQLEQALCGGLGEVRVSLDRIFAEAALAATSGGIAQWFGWRSTTALLLAVTSAGMLVRQPWAGHPPADRAVQAAALDRAALDWHARPAPAELDERILPVPPLEEAEISSPSDAAIPPPARADRASATRQEFKAQPVRQAPAREGDSAAGDEGLYVELPGGDFHRLSARLEALEGAHQPVLKDGEVQPGIVLDGLAKLNAPWSPGTALRVRPGEGRRLQLHLWRGAQGVTLEHYEQPRPGWAAYRTTRRARHGRPLTRRLVATDGGRYVRCGQGTVDLRLQDGQLLLARGDVPLLSAPCPAAPEAVLFEGPAALADLSLVPCQPLACEAPAAENALGAATPDRLEWNRSLPPGAEWSVLAAGRGELLAEDTAAPARVFLPAPDLGLRQVAFELEDPLPGAGVFLGDPAGRPLVQVGFFLDETTGQTSFGWLQPGEVRTTARVVLGRGPAPLGDLRPWLRLTLGGGAAMCSVSGDGVHWSPALEPLPLREGGLATAGLFALPGGGARCIRLRRIEARPLAAIEALADSALRAQVSGLDGAADFAGWRRAAASSSPLGVDRKAWRRACAVQLLAGAARPDLASDILLDLLADALSDDALSPQRRIALLGEAALIYHGRSADAVQAFVKLYERLGLALLRESETRPYSAVRRAWMTSPLQTAFCANALPVSLVRFELSHLAARDDAAPLEAFCRQLRFFAPDSRASEPSADRDELERLISQFDPP